MASTLSEGLKGFQGDTSEVLPPATSQLKGQWNIGTTYLPGDQVLYNGSGYVAKVESTGFVPEQNLNPDSVNSGGWQQIARRGSTGSAAVPYSRTTSSFVQPAVNGQIFVSLDTSSAWIAVGSTVYMESGGYYSVSSVMTNSVSLQNLGYENAAPGVTVAIGKLLTTAGFRGVSGNSIPSVNAFSVTTAVFTQPPINSTVNVITSNTGWMIVGQTIFIGGSQFIGNWSTYYTVTTVVNASTVTLTNLGYTGSTEPGAIAGSGLRISPAGVRGVLASPSSSYVDTYGWIVPPVESTIFLSIGAVPTDKEWMAPGQVVFIQGAGHYRVQSLSVGSKNVTLENLGYSGNRVPGVAINVLQPRITPAGIIGLPSYTTTADSFTQPSVGSTVTAVVGNTQWMAIGQILYIANAGYYSVWSITSITAVVLTNLGYAANVTVGAATGGGSSSVVSAGVKGDSSPSFGVLTAGATQPTVGSNVTVSCNRTDWMIVGAIVFIGAVGYYQVSSISSATSVSLTNLGYTGSASPGSNIPNVSQIGVAGVRGFGASTFVTTTYTQPAVNSTVAVSVENTQWMTTGQILFVEAGGFYSVSSISSLTVVTLTNLNYAGNVAPGTGVTANGRVSPGGLQGSAGLSSVSVTIATFTQPAINSTVVVAMGSSSWLSVGQIAFIQGGGYYSVSALPSPTSATLSNLGYIGNAAVSGSVGSGAIVSPGGLQGASGSSTFTSLTAAFTQPAIASTVIAAVVSSVWMAIGQVIFIESGGYYQVTALPSTASATLKNLGYAGNANPSVSVAISSTVSAGGFQGATGFNAYTALTTGFTQPATGSTVIASVVNSSAVVVGQAIFIAIGGYYTVTAIPDAVSVTIQNLGYSGNQSVGLSVPTGGGVSSGGLRGAVGSNTWSVTIDAFTQPAVSSSVSISVGSSDWMAIGQVIFIQNGGYYSVTSTATSTTCSITNLGYTGNTSPGANVPGASDVSPAGLAGTDGIRGFGIPYQFDTSTSVLPPTGKLRFNNASLASVTAVYVHESDRNGIAIASVLDRIPNGSPLQISLENTPSTYAYYTLNSQTDNGTDRTLSVTYLSGGGTFTNNANASLSFGITGPTGSAGGPIGILHTFDSVLVTTPAVGRLRFNNATVSSVTQIYLNETDRNNADIGTVLATITNGSLVQISKENSTTYAFFSLINQVDNGSYRTLNVTYLSGNGVFANTDNVVLAPFVKGLTGTGPGFFPTVIDIDPRIMTPRWSDGATAFAAVGALTTGRTDYRGLAFSGSSDQFAQFDIKMPGNYNGGTVTAQFYWIQTVVDAGDAEWAISAIAFAADETMDQAFGTQEIVVDTFIAAYRIHVSAASPALAIANSPTAGKWVTFQVGRLGAQASDTLTSSVILTKVTLTYTST